MKHIAAVLLILCCFALNLVGCGKSDAAAAEDATTAFLAASNSGNRPAWLGSMTKAAQVQLEMPEGKKVAINQKHSTPYTVGKAVISDSAAEIPVKSKDAQGKPVEALVKLTKEEGVWKVWAMTFTVPINFTVDFEHPETLKGEMIKALGKKQ